MEQAVVTGKLIGDVTVKSHRAVNGPADREKQMVILTQINHRACVERRAGIGKVGLRLRLMIDLHANEHIGQNLFLENPTGETLIVVAGKGIEAVATPAVGRPRTPTLLHP